MTIGRRTWAVAEGYIPSGSVSQARDLVSHEAICILNAGEADAEVRLTLFFEDRAPAGPYIETVGGRRTRHLRLNDFTNPEVVPRDTAYSMLIEASAPVVVQHTRLDSRNPNVALLSTMAFPVD